ncbi:MAG: SRPBCC domain-containing protein [Alphaproteobacteria bacterium]|jgi:uncharacterized protein YndB with AHSA1/START domain|nr:SRPBCC domain-containing protein [Alphaproteobacteria bacterium]
MIENNGDPVRPTARLSRRFTHSRDKVFRAWSDPSLVIRWFGGADDNPIKVTMDCRTGGAYQIIFSEASRIEGEYLAVERPARLVFSWRHVQTLDDGAENATPESQVTVTFEEAGEEAGEESGDETELTVLHERLSSEAGRAGVSAGWLECFDKIDALLLNEE